MHRPSNGQKPGYVAGQNAFAALDTKAKKKPKKGKDDKGKKDRGKSGSVNIATTGGVGSTTATLPTITDVNFEDLNWAEEDEDDGFAMAPMADWVQEHQQLKAQAQADAAHEEQEEVEEDNHDMVNISNQLGMEVGHEEEEEEETDDDESESQSKPTSRNVSEIVASGASQRPMEPKVEEKQLSKKELKKKEMEALAVTLEELGIGADDVAKENESSAAAAKRKKKKEKKQTAAPDEPKNGEAAPSEPVLELQESTSAVANGSTEQGELAKVIDPSEARKKLASKAAAKKKKGAQVNPAIARAAAEEAKVRAGKESAQKDKDKKKNYNQERR